jgi:aryl-alcohol dehydrogenase-like predicted oxidoreductase
MKLALGTAQFGLSYGVANAVGRIPPAEGAAILRRAAQASFDTLDTAIAYGDSEACLGEIGVSTWQIVTKLPALPEAVGDVSEWVGQQVSASLRRLRVSRLGALLLHRPADLLGAHSAAYRHALQGIKGQGLIQALGVSIYDPAELDALWPAFRPDLVQAPLNVLDRRLIHTGWLERLVGEGVRVHTRSAFLQGLLLMPASKRPAYFQRWAALLDRWLGWCAKQACTPLRAALAFAMARPGVEKVVVGVDSVAQLEEILAAAAPALLPPDNFISEDRDLIEPSRWKLS